MVLVLSKGSFEGTTSYDPYLFSRRQLGTKAYSEIKILKLFKEFFIYAFFFLIKTRVMKSIYDDKWCQFMMKNYLMIIQKIKKKQ